MPFFLFLPVSEANAPTMLRILKGVISSLPLSYQISVDASVKGGYRLIECRITFLPSEHLFERKVVCNFFTYLIF